MTDSKCEQRKINWDHKNKKYVGTSYWHLLSVELKRAWSIYYKQKDRSGVCYPLREFLYWYMFHPKGKKLVLPNVARFDHSKPYSWDNIELQEQAENVKERNERRGNPGKTHRAVVAIDAQNGKKLKEFASKRTAAAYFNVSEKTIYNHCQKRTKQPFKFGPKYGLDRKFTFIWK